MVSRPELRQTLLGRDVAVAYAVVIALYVVRVGNVRPLQIPAYLLLVAYDVVEMALPALDPYHPVGFPVFLYLLAVVAAGAARWVSGRESDRPVWRRAAGGVCLVVGVISLLFGAMVGGPLVSPTDNPTPLLVTGATGSLLLVAGWWALRGPSPPVATPR